MRKAIVVLALILSACNSRSIYERDLSKEDEAFAIHVFEQLQQQRISEVAPLVDQKFFRDASNETLAEMATVLREKPTAMRVIAGQTFLADGIRRTYLTLEYQMRYDWVAAGMVIRTQNGKRVIESLDAAITPDSYEQRARFTLRGKSVIQYTYLMLAVLVPLFILFTLYVLWRTPVARLKWLWFIFVALGICSLSVNWMNGLTHVRLLWVQLLGFGFGRVGPYEPYAPVVVSWAIPVGAIVFLLLRRSLMSPRAETYT